MARIFMAAYTNYRRDPRVKREAEALVAEGHEVVFLARRQPDEPSRETIAGVKVVKTFGRRGKPNSFLAYIVDYLLFLLIMTAHLTLRPRRYALIHVNNMPDFLVLGAWLPRLLGTPVIHDIHDLMPELYTEKFEADEHRWVIRVLLLQERLAGRFASAVLTVEERLRDILSGRGIRAGKIHVLLNLPDERIFRARPEPPKKPPGAPFVLVYHGTLARRLGLDIAIEALPRVREQAPNVQFRIIGAGEERDRLIKLRDDLGLQDVVSLSNGYVPVEQLPELLADADLGVIPLRVQSGTDVMLPTKLLEYVNIGIPCITPRTGTICRYFDETMVRFFEPENPESLADAILELYRDPKKRERLHRTASEKFLSKYRWHEHRKVYTDLVQGLLSGSDAGAAQR